MNIDSPLTNEHQTKSQEKYNALTCSFLEKLVVRVGEKPRLKAEKRKKKESNQSSGRKKNDVDEMKSKMFRNHRSIEVIAIVIEWRTHVVFCCAVADRDTLRPKIENQDNARPAINISLLFHFDTVDERRSI